MVRTAYIPKEEYPLLLFETGERIPHILGTGVRAENIYVSDYKREGRTISKIARDRDMQEEAVRQAIDWCMKNDRLITLVLAKERREAGLND